MRAQFTVSKKGCCLISVAPLLNPNLFCGSFMSRPRIKSFAAKLREDPSENFRGCPATLNNVSRFPLPLKGVLPRINSYKKIPNVHQSTALPWPSPLIISGAKYSWVPTNDMDRAVVGSATSTGSARFGFSVLLADAVLGLKKRGLRQEGCKQEGSTQTGNLQAGSIQDGSMQYEEILHDESALD
ncbi:hypothetical protein OIU77_019388 [Salix suchowensis]|uniref:Uncharacterized protein n=1 Tax=Salix suchowensis TaxID=1278906 RepID=A0ABQ9CJY6_9ROSI|nr:hypothetical protein OIU77_019388 [Salix suchowensis]